MTLTTSIRLQILQAMQTRFESIVQTISSPPQDSDWPFQFSLVEIGPLADEDQRKRLMLGIVDGHERTYEMMPFIRNILQVALEFKVTVNSDDPAPGVLVNQVLTFIQRIILIDRTWGGLAMETKFTDSQVFLDNYLDRSAQGVVGLEVQYRFNSKDPRNPNMST